MGTRNEGGFDDDFSVTTRGQCSCHLAYEDTEFGPEEPN